MTYIMAPCAYLGQAFLWTMPRTGPCARERCPRDVLALNPKPFDGILFIDVVEVNFLNVPIFRSSFS